MAKAAALGLLSITTLLGACSESVTGAGGGGGTVTSQSGSLSRMAITDQYLYTVYGSKLSLFDISEPATPLPYTEVSMDARVETLFPYRNYLLIGAENGVFIFDNSDPASPVQVGEFTHARTHDPVVAQDDIAYVSLRRDTSMPNGIPDQMNVVDIADPSAPTLIESQAMDAPRGLAVSGNRLYVCDGESGLKTYDLTDPRHPSLKATEDGLDCVDLIVNDNTLVVVAKDGIHQYDRSADKLLPMSSIATAPIFYVTNP